MSKKIIRRNSLFKLCRLISTGAQVPPAPEHQLERKYRLRLSTNWSARTAF